MYRSQGPRQRLKADPKILTTRAATKCAKNSGHYQEPLAATVIAAAKHYAQTTKANMVGVVLDGGFKKPAANIQLARCNYAPDGKGVSGTDNWTWNDVRAADRGLTAEEQRAGGYRRLEEVPADIADTVPAQAPTAH